MGIHYITGDLFDAEKLIGKPVYFVQCISADLAMGAGIALQFNVKFNVKKLLTKYVKEQDIKVEHHSCMRVGKVYNLVTKMRYSEKPKLRDMGESLENLRKLCLEERIKTLAMPKIGCGLDKLKWDAVADLINSVICSADIEVYIFCK